MRAAPLFPVLEHGFQKTVFTAASRLKAKRPSDSLAVLFFSLAFTLTACRDTALPRSFRLSLPAPPPAWEDLLGPPVWRVEWFGPDGRLCSAQGPGPALPELELPAEWASPVLAYPFWPERGLAPGLMRPAGAIAPFDVEGGSLTLSWEAGAEAYFYRALAAAYKAAGLSSSSRPERFDWPRFRLLMASAAVPKELREDPWLTDWKAAAEQTARSGFDRRRIRARSSKMLTVKIPWPGPWTGSSPFTKARLLEAGGAAELEAGAETDIMVSKDGILKYSVDGVIAVSW